ncbi:Gfo/Idh/MocA family oxidoreductase [bacterium]|nr:MAG: Gfo/Idh/MocA family oxidoreductase [bacterium]
MRPLRVGVAGAGYGVRFLVPAFRAVPGVRVDAVSASTPESAARAARAARARGVVGWRALVTDPGLDAVVLALPPRLQPAAAALAAESGKAVFLEKPLALSLPAADALAKALRRTPNGIGFEFGELPAYRAARAAASRLGRLRGAAVSWRLASPSLAAARGWKGTADSGALRIFAVHAVDMLLRLVGPARRVWARREYRPAGADARASLCLELSGGVSATLDAVLDAPGGTGWRLAVWGERGSLSWEAPGGDPCAAVLSFTPASGKRRVLSRPTRGADAMRLAASAALAARFAKAARGGPACVPGVREGLAAQRVLEAAARSARSGRWEAVR